MLAEFFFMGGFAFYIWTSVVVFLVSIFFELFFLLYSRKKTIRNIKEDE
jgi:heme exporter protein CcmD